MCQKGWYRAGFIRRYRSGHSVFVFHLQPGKPPVDVMLVIIRWWRHRRPCKLRAVLMSCCNCREAAAPQPEICLNCRAVCACTLTILCGTGHVVYTILPISTTSPLRTTSVRNVRWRLVLRCTDGDYRQSGIGCGRVSGSMLGNVTFDGRHLEFLDLLASPFHRR